MMTTPSISIVIITWRRAPLVIDCLESLEKAGMRDAEAWIGVNGLDGSGDRLPDVVRRRFPWANVVQHARASRGHARNRLVPRTRGRLIAFLDDDVLVPSTYLQALARKEAEHPNAPWFGGPNLGPPGASAFERAADFALRSPVAVGPVRVRYRAGGADRPASGWCFTLANLAVRREVFEREALAFPEICVCAEENLFLHRVESRRGKGLWSTDLSVYHRRRATPAGLSRQIAQYGLGRMQITRADPSSLPKGVRMSVSMLAAFAVLASALRFPPLALAGVYLGCVGVETLRLLVQEADGAAAPWLALVIPLVHASYVCGLLAGFWAPREKETPLPCPAAVAGSGA